MAREINTICNGTPMTIVGVMTGSVVLLADLIRLLEMPLRVGVVAASSYRGTATSPSELAINSDFMPDIKDRHVLIVDDIFDTGRTMSELVSRFHDMGPASVRCAVLLRKRDRQEIEMEPDFIGFDIPDEFVVGYGLDYQDAYRNLPFVASLEAAEIVRCSPVSQVFHAFAVLAVMTDRVLFIVPTGAEPLFAADHFAAGLREAGAECLLCDAGLVSARSMASFNESPCASIDRARPWDVMAIGRLRDLISDFGPRVIYVMSGDADLFALAAAAKFDCQIVLQRANPLSKVERLLRSTNVHLLTSSQAERRKLLEAGCRTPVLTVLPSLPVRGEPRTKRWLTEQLSIPADTKLLGTVADFVSQDRLRDVVWVADLMKAARDDTHVLIFGDGPEWLRLERYRRRLEIEDCVHFLGRPPDLSSWLAPLDGFWCAAGSDSIHSSMCAVLGLGIPLVVSDTLGHRELVRHEENGLLFPVGNRAHFARQSLRILEEPGLAKRLSSAATTAWQHECRPQRSRDELVAAHRCILQHARLAA